MCNFGRDIGTLASTIPTRPRVMLVRMNDPYNVKLPAGCKGLVRCVADEGTIHVEWDCGSRLGMVYGEDLCEVIEE